LNTKSVSDLPKSGKPLKTTVRERRHICRISKKDPFLKASELAANCNILQKLSVCTIRRYLRNGRLFGRRASRKPFFIGATYLKPEKVVLSVLGKGPGKVENVYFF